MNIKKSIIIIAIIFLLSFLLIIIIPTILLNKSIKMDNIRVIEDKYGISKDINIYNIADLLKYKANNENYLNDKYYIYLKNENSILYDGNIELNVDDGVFNEKNTYSISINDEENNINYDIEINGKSIINIGQLNDEGKYNFNITLYENGEVIYSIIQKIFYIKPYKKQFAECISNKGVATHYYRPENYKLSGPLLKNIGARYVRTDFPMKIINTSLNNYDFECMDYWVNDLENNNINIIAILNANPLINSEQTIKDYCNFYLNVKKRYPKIKDYEIMNEPNFIYKDEKMVRWYSNLLKQLDESNIYNDNICTGGTTTGGTVGKYIKSLDFYDLLNKTGGIISSNCYAFHNYDSRTLRNIIEEHYNNFNSYGGFCYINVTEYGSSTADISELAQARDDVKQTIFLEEKCKYAILYSLWSNTDDNNWGEQLGILYNDYTPKPSYYAMKNFYENTNGSEYIGQVNIADGLEAHVYDKDGKPKIIVWATDKNNPITVDYSGYTAKDLYGNDIENTNGTLEITSSPIYLDNVSTKYFYEAISNSITSGYNEFNTKFATEISKVDGLSNKISTLSSYASTLSNVDTLNEDIANSKMQEHFNLGNMLINAYNNKSLDVEYVKLSSMLDYLNTIGNSYEDLVTVSAKSRITDLTSITNKVNSAKLLAQNTANIDIVYPNKIYKFAQDLLDTSSYVLGLEEENDIKTGLINSKAIHAKYLAEWSEEFSKIYIRESYQDSVNKIEELNIDLKNNNINVYQNINISNIYNNLINGFDIIIKNPERLNLDIVNNIYNKQFDLIKTIVNENNAKRVDASQYAELINQLVDISDNYKKLYSLYLKNDDIDSNDLALSLNEIIDRYNDNIDIDLSNVTSLINKLKDIYNNSIDTDNTSDNYLNKLKIQKTCEIISNILENDIKTKADEELKNIKVEYSSNINIPTNKDITAQIKLPSNKCSIENNPINTKYTFTENGTQNITINIRGYKYNINIEVNNIDKTLPQITGIEQDEQYKEKVTPQITDENLSEIKLLKDGQTVKDYEANSSITQEGIYQLIAKDGAGNETTINFIIAYPEDEKYIIENNTVKNINCGTKISTLKERLQISENYKIKRNNNEVKETENIATGDILETESGITYTLIVKGDINKDGNVNVRDLVKMRKYILLGNNLDETEKMAADTNVDGKEISVRDLVKLRIMLLISNTNVT